MRATISFDIEVDQVEPTMAILIAQEADTLRAAADMIDVQPGPRNMVLEEVTEALRLMNETSAQLEQYRSMLVSFERARFETVMPQDVNTPAFNINPDSAAAMNSLRDVQVAVASMNQFDGFVNKINQHDEEQGDGEQDEPQEG